MFRFQSLVCAAALALSFVATSCFATTLIIDGEGFESPYSTTFSGTGQLEGQAAKLPNDAPFPGATTWVASIGTTSSAVVTNSMASTGTQSVRIDRAANEPPGGGRWGANVVGWPSERYVCIEWDMKVLDAGGPSGSFGPFFGVEAYDDDGVAASNGRIGVLGVDATTGDVLYTSTGTGFLTETGTTVSFGSWYTYRIDLDFLTHEYGVYVNDVLLLTEPFEEGAGLDQLTDAPLATFAAAGDSVSLGLTGTAFFDNYSVFQMSAKVPEPGSLLLVVVAGLGVAVTRRRW
ncbi:MAG: PEP-CTERM sorting domain-containing protein [Planctomycetales bacterium]|nr:PEP-CTERM sorting domain-containing protein [Planctomycetales bacterium]